ncbi:MAG: EpsG family protein [Cetobacterium sp.]|uniref:EpsG family protein n=1 Tax=Cetobacterium sp. TaxID=2071632 RepID=UPI003F363407
MILLFLNIILILISFFKSLKKKWNILLFLLVVYFYTYNLFLTKLNVDLEYYKSSYFRNLNSLFDLRLEKGYVLLVNIFNYFKIDFLQFHLIVFLFIIFSFVYVAYRNYGELYLAAILFLSYYGMYYTHVVIRIGIATGIIIYIFQEKKINKYVQLCLIYFATYFHSTAIIYILYLLIPNKLYSKKKYMILFLIGYICYYSRIGLVIYNKFKFIAIKYIPKYSYYLLMDKNSLGFSIRYLMWSLIIVLLLMLVSYKSISNKKELGKILNFYILGFLIYSIFGFFETIDRIGDIFFIVQYLVILGFGLGIKKEYKILYFLLLCNLILINTLFVIRFAKV